MGKPIKKPYKYLIYKAFFVGQRLQVSNHFAKDLLKINDFIIKHGLVY